MDTDLLLLGASIFLGLLFIGLSVPLIQRRISPNRCYGVRVPATLADETVWYEVNARAGRELAWLGTIVVGVGAVLYLLRMPLWLELVLWFIVVEGGVVGIVVRSWRLANRLFKERRGAQGESA